MMEYLLGGLPDLVIFIILYGYLFCGIFITYKLFRRRANTKTNWAFIIAILFNIFNFYIVNDLMTVSPEVSSGNGNPHIPYILISIVLFLLLCIVLSSKIINFLLKRTTFIKVLILAIALSVALGAFSLQSDFVASVNEQLYHPMGEWWNWWKDIHLNNLYLNFYTFVFGVSIAAFLGSIFTLLKREIKLEEKN